MTSLGARGGCCMAGVSRAHCRYTCRGCASDPCCGWACRQRTPSPKVEEHDVSSKTGVVLEHEGHDVVDHVSPIIHAQLQSQWTAAAHENVTKVSFAIGGTEAMSWCGK